jgi:multiple sugar transport system ATP-binding protein
MVAGLEEVTAGQISIGDRVVNGVPPKDRDIAMVFQNYALYPHMTVAENMGFSLRMRGEPRTVIERKVREAAAILGLEPYLDRKPAQLSGGQRQRVAMGRAIVRAPKVFLFDEPLSNLDAQLRVQMRAELRDLHQRLGTTTIYVTHDQVEAMTLASSIVVLNAGRVEQTGPPLELYDRPSNTFVARFIGSPAMNLVEAVVCVAGGTKSARTDDGDILPLPAACHVPVETRIVWGVRPEHLQVAASGLAVDVASVEHTGAETHVMFARNGCRLTGVFRERMAVRQGERIFLGVGADRVHVFDGQTGRRIDALVGSGQE